MADKLVHNPRNLKSTLDIDREPVLRLWGTQYICEFSRIVSQLSYNFKVILVMLLNCNNQAWYCPRHLPQSESWT